MFDMLIKNGRIIDGTGSAAYPADLAVENGRIAALDNPGRIPEASCQPGKVIDAGGRCVTPGFIDIHRHADNAVFRPDFGRAELHQGLTTIVNGNCGQSAVPCSGDYVKEIQEFEWPVVGSFPDFLQNGMDSLAEYEKQVEKENLPVHTGMLVGNGAVCASVAGYRKNTFSDDEVRAIHRKYERMMEEGVLGISLGLEYMPECLYSKDTVIRMLEPMRGSNLPLVTHVRNEGDQLHEALREVIDIARALQVPLHVSHLKCMGRRSWGRGMKESLRILQDERDSGMDVTCDFYPYIAGSTQAMLLIPPKYQKNGVAGLMDSLRSSTARDQMRAIMEKPSKEYSNILEMVGWDKITLTSLKLEKDQQFTGMTVTQIAAERQQDPFDCFFDLLLENECCVTMIDEYGSEEDIETIMHCPWSNIISDSIYPDAGNSHPRVCGTFARVIEKYVCREHVLTLEEAVHKMTLLPAVAMRLKGKGELKAGMDADILIFDPAHIHEMATYTNPSALSRGFAYVISNGRIVLQDD